MPHVRNFIECIRTRRQPVSNLAGAHRTATACHLANIAMRVGRAVRWDEGTQDIVGDGEASRLLGKTYRAPWDRELRAIVPSAGTEVPAPPVSGARSEHD